MSAITNLGKRRLPRGGNVQFLIAVGVVLAFAVLVSLAFGVTWRSGERVVEAAQARTQAMARILNQHAIKTVDSVDMLLRAVAKELGPDPQDMAKRSATTSLLAELTRNQPYVRAVRMLNGDSGRELYDFAPGRDISYGAETEVIQAHHSSAEGALQIGKPFLDPLTRAWIVSVSRRVTARDGIPGNFVVAHVAIDYFERFYDEVDIGSEGSVTLFRSDGVVLVRRPNGSSHVGRSFAKAELFQEQLPRAPIGTYEAVSSVDGIKRLISYRRVDSLPLVIAVTLAADEIQAAWRQEALRDLAIALGAIAVLVVLGLILLRLNRQRAETERVLRVTLDNMDQGLLMFDADDTVQVCNRRAADLLGLPADLLASKPRFTDLIAYQRASGEFDGLPEAASLLEQAGQTTPLHGMYERRRPNGTVLEVRTVRLPGGGAVRTFMDVTARREAEASVAESEARYRLLAENATDMIVQADLDTTRRYVSPACRELLGYAPEELVGTRPLDAVHPEDLEHYRAILESFTRGHTEQAVSRQRYRRKDGSFVWTEATFRLIRDGAGQPTGYVAAVRDISERRQLEEQLRELARTDALTGLFNRRAFEERLEEEWRRALRTGSAFGLLTLDVDFFKQFNDHFGHGAGDACLREVAELLRQDRRATDFAARTGGEEFALLLPETELAGALVVAEGIRARLEAAGIAHPNSPHGVVTASIGVAAFRPQVTESVADLLGASDQAMYEAKRTGRNRVVSAAALTESASAAAA
jgi:diguanylate cyclase (GGDEF)-like protein/PAS domain S-box-containing protein